MQPISHPSLQVELVDEVVVVRFTPVILCGDSLRDVHGELLRLLDASACRELQLDLANVELLNASGLGQLVALYNATRAEGKSLRLVNVAPCLFEIFELTHLNQVLDISPSLAGSVMVIEDDAATRSALKNLLEAEGYRVACAADGQEALDHLRENETPSVILLDLMMDGMDGWQFRKEQKQDPALASIPVVVVSAADESSVRAASLGDADFIR